LVGEHQQQHLVESSVTYSSWAALGYLTHLWLADLSPWSSNDVSMWQGKQFLTTLYQEALCLSSSHHSPLSSTGYPKAIINTFCGHFSKKGN
jgi:hypothetical protein